MWIIHQLNLLKSTSQVDSQETFSHNAFSNTFHVLEHHLDLDMLQNKLI